MNLRTSCVLLAGIGQIALTASALGQSSQSTADSSGQEAQKQEAGGIADIVVTAQRRGVAPACWRRGQRGLR